MRPGTSGTVQCALGIASVTPDVEEVGGFTRIEIDIVLQPGGGKFCDSQVDCAVVIILGIGIVRIVSHFLHNVKQPGYVYSGSDPAALMPRCDDAVGRYHNA